MCTLHDACLSQVMAHNIRHIPASFCTYWPFFKTVTSLILPAVFTDLIQPICLPLPPDIRSRDFVKNYPFIAGWGSVHFSECQDRNTKQQDTALSLVLTSSLLYRVLLQMAHPAHTWCNCRFLWWLRHSVRKHSKPSALPTLMIVSCVQGLLEVARMPVRYVLNCQIPVL
jgi:hypothetical protein